MFIFDLDNSKDMIEQIRNSVLKYLCEEYFKKHGAGVSKIDSLVGDCNPQDIGMIFYHDGYLKEPFHGENKSFSAKISMKGIRKINPDWINDMEIMVMAALGSLNDGVTPSSGIEMTGLEAIDLRIVKDFYEQLEKIGYVEITLTPNDVLVTLTPLGRAYLESNKALFLD